MALPVFPIGFNFRDTLGYVTDQTPNVFSGISVSFSDTVGYGWVTTTGAISVDRGAVGGPSNLAGAVLTNNAGISAPISWRVNVDPSKSYQIRMALGDGLYSYPYAQVRVYNGSDVTPLFVVNGIEAGQVNGEYIDASGVRRNNYTSWLSDNEPVLISAPNGFLRVEVGVVGGPGFSGLSHFSLTELPSEPVVSEQPSDVEVTQPTSAIFSTAVTGSYASLQWQTRVNSSSPVSDITGAVSLSYNTGVTSLSLSGSQYRLKIDWLGGTVYSNWATLYVNDGPPGVIPDTTTVVTSESTCTFSWSNGTPPGSSFVVQLESPYNSNNWITPPGSFSGNSFLATTLPANTDLRFRVRPVNAAGTNSYTTGVIFRVDNLVTGGDVVETLLLFTQLFNWSILGSTSASLSFNWSILNKVLTDLGFNWDILSKVDRQFIYTWIIGETSSGAEIDYNQIALAVMNFVLTNGKTVQEQLLLLEKQNNVSIALSA